MMLTQELLKAYHKKAEPDYNALITMAMESLASSLHGNYELNLRRRELIKPDLHKDYHPLCSTAKSRSSFLGVSKEVKEIADLNRVGNQVFGRGTRGYGRSFRGRSRGFRQQNFLGRGRGSSSRGRRPQQAQNQSQ